MCHATLQEFPVGKIVEATTPSNYYPNVLTLLEQHRPHNFPSRSNCVFAADSPEASKRFLISQPNVRPEEIKIYQVQMDCYHKAPFRVIHELSNRIKSSGATDKLVNEYWQPKHDWVFWEYFGPSFTVLGELAQPNPVEVYAFGFSYEKDRKLSATF